MSSTTKRELVVRISDKTGHTQGLVSEILEEVIAEISNELGRGGSIAIRKFGKFEVSLTKARKGRNPQNPGVEIVIPPRSTVKFRPGKELKDKVAPVLPSLKQSVGEEE